MNPRNVFSMLAELRMLRFFPPDEEVIAGLARLCGNMCENEDQVRWLVNRMTSGLYAEWPGPAEMRACFCSRFKPKNGIEMHSGVYLDGIPVEHPKLLNSPDPVALPEGHTAADGQLEKVIFDVAAVKTMPMPRPLTWKERQFAAQLQELITAPCDREPIPMEPKQVEMPPLYRRVTLEDIDQALTELHLKKSLPDAAGLE